MLQTSALHIHEVTHQQPQPVVFSLPNLNIKTSLDSCLNFYPGFIDSKLSPANKKIVQSITLLFESWQSWQKKIMFSSLIHRYSKKQLKSLHSAIESLYHRDFVAIYQNAYPMHRIKERQYVPIADLKRLKKERMVAGKYAATTFSRNDFLKSVQDLNKDEDIPLVASPKLRKRKKLKNVSRKHRLRMSVEKKNLAKNLYSFSLSSNNHADGNRIKHSLPVEKKDSLVSLPSIWAMGESADELDETFDFRSQVSSLDNPTEDYFAPISNHFCVGDIVTTASKHDLDQFMTRFNEGRNQLPFPSVTQLHKSSTLWPSHQQTVNSSAVRLKELFQKQFKQIWEWIDDWQEYRRVRLLLHFLSLSTPPEQKFIRDCIKQKIKEFQAQESLAASFPRRVWLRIIDYLNVSNVEAAELTCKAWNRLFTTDNLWIQKCKEIGKKLRIPNFIELIENSCAENETPDWRGAYFILRDYVQLNVGDREEGDEPSVDPVELVNYLQTKQAEASEIEKKDVMTPALAQTDEKSKSQSKKVSKLYMFPLIKRRLSATKFEEFERVRRIKEAEEKLENEEHEKRQGELKRKKLQRIEEIMFIVQPLMTEEKVRESTSRSRVRFTHTPSVPDAPPAVQPLSKQPHRSSFLQMWSNIVEG